MTHTPGPWHFNGRRITTGAFIVADIWNADEPVGQANAALIAAAPDLYRALYHLANTVIEDLDTLEVTDEMVDAASAALRKAEGREP